MKHAQALQAAGRDDEALRLYSTIGKKYGIEFVLRAPVFLEEARILDRRGDRRGARLLMQRFTNRWRDAESLYQPLAQRGLVAMR